MHRFKLSLLSALVPLICTGVLLVALLLWKLFDLPDPKETYHIIDRLFSVYGLPLVFAAALLEGIAVVNIYAPGSAVIVLGVMLSKGEPLMAVYVVSLTTIAFILTAQINYALGYFGLHQLLRRLGGGVLIDKAQSYWHRHGAKTLPLAFIHPNIGGFVSIAAGNGRYSWRLFLFYSSLFIALWNTIWGFAAYFLSEIMVSAATQPFILLGALLVWTAFSFLSTYIRVKPDVLRDSSL